MTKITEIWKPVVGFEELYEVSSLGNIKSLRFNKIMTPSIHEKRKRVVLIDKESKKYSKKVHRLVGEAFIPNPENKPQINHINHNPLDNVLGNLEWCTGTENTRFFFQRRIKRKFSLDDINGMYEIYKGGHSLSYISKQYNVDISVIQTLLYYTHPNY